MNQGIRSKSRDESHDRTENKSGGHRMMSHINIAYHRSNVVQGKVDNAGYLTLLAEGQTPTQQNLSISNDDDDAYESVT